MSQVATTRSGRPGPADRRRPTDPPTDPPTERPTDMTPDPTATTLEPRSTRGLPVPGVLALGALASLGVLVAGALLGGAADPAALGDPGPLTRWGLLVARLLNDVAAIGTLGILLVALVLLPRAGDGFGPDAARLVRRATWWAGLWAVAALVTMLFTLSTVAGRSVAAVLAPDVLPLVMDLESTRSLLSSAWLAVLVAIGSRVTRSPGTGVLLLLGAVAAVVLPLLTGHAGHGEIPAVTATSLALHVVAAAAWVGGLGVLVVHLRRSELALAVALPRFSRMALVCYAVVGASGALTGWAYLTTVERPVGLVLRAAAPRQGRRARRARAGRPPAPPAHGRGGRRPSPARVRPPRRRRARPHGVRRRAGRGAVAHRAAG